MPSNFLLSRFVHASRPPPPPLRGPLLTPCSSLSTTASSPSPPPISNTHSPLSQAIAAPHAPDGPRRALALFHSSFASLNVAAAADRPPLSAAAIHALCSGGMFPHAIRLTKELVQSIEATARSPAIGSAAFHVLSGSHGSKFTPLAFGVLIIALSQTGLVEDALLVFSQLKELPAAHACNALLDGLLKAGRLDCVWKLYGEMLSCGLEPNVVTYNTLINVCRHQVNIAKARQLLDEMASKKIDPTVVTYTTMICSLCEEGEVGEAEMLFTEMREFGVLPNLYAYNALINGHCKNANVRRALEFYQQMISESLLPNPVTFTTLINGLCQESRTSDAKKLFLDMPRYGVLPTVPIYNSLLDGFCSSGDMQEASRLYQEMAESGLCPDVFTCSIMVKGLCGIGRVQEADEFFKKTQQGGVQMNSVSYNVLVNGYCRQGSLEEALAVCSQMSEEGIDPNVVTYSSLIDGHCKRGGMDIAMAIYTEMVAKGVVPNIVTYSALIDGHVKQGSLNEAFRLQKEMSEKGIKPNSFTLTSLIHGLCMEDRVRDAVNIFMLTVRDGNLNEITYMALIYGLYRDGQHLEAGRFYSSMREYGLVPDGFTYTILMRGQCLLGYLFNAALLYGDMLKIGAKPSSYFVPCPDIWPLRLVAQQLVQGSALAGGIIHSNKKD